MLAAGGGRRLGGPKALLRLNGKPLVERAVATARDGGCDPVVVVLGAAADRVRAEADLGDALTVVNKAWSTGLGSSLRVGLTALADIPVQAAVVLLVDMPGVNGAAIRRVAALPYPSALVCASYGGRRGHPMLLGREHWSGIATLAAADVGARPYLLAHRSEVQDIRCDDLADDGDIDTPEDAERWGIVLPASDGDRARADRPVAAAAATAADLPTVGPYEPRMATASDPPVAAATPPHTRQPGERPAPRPRR